jgi:uncharacterized spore protein YtfJ
MIMLEAGTMQSADRIVQESNGLVDRLAERMGAQARASTIYGEPIERGGVTVIPVARAMWGFGGGAGNRSTQETGSGGGGGMLLTPVGYIEISNGQTRYRPIFGTGLLAFWGMTLALGSLSILTQARRRLRRR